MIKCLRLPFAFDPAGLLADLALVRPDEWVAHFNRNDYEGDWSGVALRAVGGDLRRIYPDPSPGAAYADTELMARCPHLRAAVATFRCPVKSARLLRLAAGSNIVEHRDEGLCYEDGEARLHVPIQTDAAVAFYLDGRRLVMNPGEAWYVNVHLPHRVDNASPRDRVHLVIDCRVDEWLDAIVRAAPPVPEGPLPERGFAAFRDVVAASPELTAALWAESDATAFEDLAVRLGRENGFTFTAGEVREAIRAGRRAWIERWVR